MHSQQSPEFCNSHHDVHIEWHNIPCGTLHCTVHHHSKKQKDNPCSLFSKTDNFRVKNKSRINVACGDSTPIFHKRSGNIWRNQKRKNEQIHSLKPDLKFTSVDVKGKSINLQCRKKMKLPTNDENFLKRLKLCIICRKPFLRPHTLPCYKHLLEIKPRILYQSLLKKENVQVNELDNIKNKHTKLNRSQFVTCEICSSKFCSFPELTYCKECAAVMKSKLHEKCSLPQRNFKNNCISISSQEIINISSKTDKKSDIQIDSSCKSLSKSMLFFNWRDILLAIDALESKNPADCKEEKVQSSLCAQHFDNKLQTDNTDANFDFDENSKTHAVNRNHNCKVETKKKDCLLTDCEACKVDLFSHFKL